MAKTDPKLAQNQNYLAIEYSCGIKTFPMDMNGCT